MKGTCSICSKDFRDIKFVKKKMSRSKVMNFRSLRFWEENKSDVDDSGASDLDLMATAFRLQSSSVSAMFSSAY